MKKFFLIFTLIFFCCGQAWADQDTLRPTGNRAGVQWLDYPSAGDDYEKIDEVSTDEDDTYLWTPSTPYLQGWGHDEWTTSNRIDSVRLVVRARSLATSGTREVAFGRQRNYGGWTWCDASAGRDTMVFTDQSYADYTITWDNAPWDNTTWDLTKLNDEGRAWVFRNHAVGTAQDSFGCSSAPSYRTPSPNYIAIFRWQADFTGHTDTLEMLYDDGDNVSNVRLAIYSDSGASPGYPYQLLDSTAVHDVSDGKNRVPLVTGSVTITNGTYYWLAHRVSAAYDTTKYEISGTNRYKNLLYSLQWPVTCPSNYSTTTTKDCLQVIGKKTVDNRVTQSFVVVYYQPEEGQVIIVH